MQADAALCGRIAENGADKVLSSEEENPSVHKTYVNFPTSRKSALDVPLYAISSGRSMVEMLGVLAIIGVLSVGAIAGYSKAMFKYKLNKQTEQIGSILDYTILYADQLHDINTWYGTELLIKLGAIPLEMTRPNEREYIYDVFNDPIIIMFTGDSTWRYYRMQVFIDDYDYNYNICLNLFQMAKLRSASLWQTVFIRATEDISGEHTNRVYGDAYCKNNTKYCLKNITLTQMHELCQICDDTNQCSLNILWNPRPK